MQPAYRKSRHRGGEPGAPRAADPGPTHHVEAKNYEAALGDVALARQESAAAGLVGNSYFGRSMDLSFNNVESAVHLRMGNPQRAREVSLSSIEGMRYSFVPSLHAEDYGRFLKDLSPEAEIKHHAAGQIMPAFLLNYASHLDEVGRFADSAQVHEAFITVLDGIGDGPRTSAPYARAAIAHALAGAWTKAGAWAERAQSNMVQRVADGQSEDNSSAVVELLDLYKVLERSHNGEDVMARRVFAARSQ